jgi:peptidoglycan/xylan/chitin deacetylase (PgdA/CDA1 family)
MLNHRNVNIFFIVFILLWILLDGHTHSSPAVYAWILLVYVSVLFCGSYFIRLGYFFKSVCSADTTEKEIALSFDDGPAPSFTPAILDVLKEKRVETIFFCIGKNIPGQENLLSRMVGEGHIIGNHSYSHHPLFDLFGPVKMRRDLLLMNETTREATGLNLKLFRPPYGVTNPHLKRAIEDGGFISIGWSVRSLDTVIGDEDRLVQKILRSLKPGAIVLLHDTGKVTVRMLGRLIDEIHEKGYRIVRLDKMLKLNPYA